MLVEINVYLLHPCERFFRYDEGSQSKQSEREKIIFLREKRKGNKWESYLQYQITSHWKTDWISDAYRIQGKIKHDDMVYIQVQSPGSQICADQCGAISIITLKFFEVFNPVLQC